MRAGFGVSLGGHLAILAFCLLALPEARPFKVDPVVALPVDLVPIAEITDLRAGDREAEPKPEAEPQPKPVVKAPVPQPERAEKPAEKVVEAAREPAPKPIRDVTKEPKPAQPQPQPQAEAAEAEPAPKPMAAPAPPEPRHVAALPKPVAPEAPAKEVEAEAAPEPEPEEAEAAPPPEAPAPAPTAPRARPKPPKLVAKAEPKPEPERKPEKAKPVPAKVSPVKATPAKPASETAEEAAFNPDDIAALLDKQEPAGGGDPEPAATPRSFGVAEGKAEAAMTQSELEALKAALYRCWNPPVAVREAGSLRVTVSISLGPDGQLAAQPSVAQPGFHALSQVAAESAMRAVQVCAPYDFLPAEKYALWREIEFTFDPREMLGG